MLKFLVLDEGEPASRWPLRNAYLIGADGGAIRGEIHFEDGAIVCEKREIGPAALALQHPVGELGELTLQTTVLPEREEPYLLSLELARHRVMLLYQKLEDWGLFGLEPDHPVARRTERARRQLLEALSVAREDSARAEALSRECLTIALDGSEELALAHAELLLNRRKQANVLPHRPLGCGIALEQNDDRVRAGLLAQSDFVQLPMPWRQLAPEEGEYEWSLVDPWVEWAGRNRLPIVAGPLVSFGPSNLPDWLYIWEHDYETVRDLIYEHVERIVTRYRHQVTAWNVVSGLHINSAFDLSFEQLMDLTRTLTLLAKQTAPRSKAIVELRQPFGEYYASEPRSIPPMMYIELLVQSGIPLDAFGVRVQTGQARPGQHARDLMQISSLLDQFAGYGKPLQVTLAAPSEPVTRMMIAVESPASPPDVNCGYWRRPWSARVQAHWLEAVSQIALSKPFVEAVLWQDVVDHPGIELPLSGLIAEDLQPKIAFHHMMDFRRGLTAKEQTPAAKAGLPPASSQASAAGPASSEQVESGDARESP